MKQNFECMLDNMRYVWNGRKWYDAERYMEPPVIVINRLNGLLNQVETNYEASGTGELVRLAGRLRDSYNLKKALEVTRHVLKREPHNDNALAVLCSILRKYGKPEEALVETNRNHCGTPAYYTSRAAAWCDLDKWEEAKKEVGRALSMGGNNGEAFLVVKRIKARKPELYERENKTR